jgi:hypothetical protein
LLNLDTASASSNVARALLGTTMLFVYPLESFVALHIGVVLLYVGPHAHEGYDAHILAPADRRVLLTMALSVCLGHGNGRAGHGFGTYICAVGGSCLLYIGPRLCYLGVHGERFLQLATQAFGKNIWHDKDEGSYNVKATISKNDLAAV